MSITREQVADLHPGDVVELTCTAWPDTVIRGALGADAGHLYLAHYIVRYRNGDPISQSDFHLTVVSRAPRPLYVNHPRTEPVPGDVARDADDEGRLTWRWCLPGLWVDSVGERTSQQQMHTRHRLRLLVDGEIGQVVP